MFALRPGVGGVILANLVPVAGVLFFGWDVWLILAVYWVENVTIGLFTLPRLWLARSPVLRLPGDSGGLLSSGAPIPPRLASAMRIFAIPFFLLHYGMFSLVHGFFVLVILPSSIGEIELADAFDLGAIPVSGEILLLAFAGIASAQAIELRQWLRAGERDQASVPEQMAAPYRRVAVLHVVLLFGGIAISAAGQALPLLIALVLAKGAYDIRQAADGARTRAA